jgi:hypothetical protein
MTPYEASFKLWWAQSHYASRSIFDGSEELAQIIFSEVWKIAIEEAAATAEDVNPFVAMKVRQLCI